MAEAVDLSPLELAIQSWVVDTSGIPDDRVIWSGYGQRRPQLPAAPDNLWISLQLSDSSDDNWPWVEEIDNPHTFTAFAFTASAASPPGLLSAAAHARLSGDGPVRLTTTGTLPAPLELATDYWVIKVADGTFRLAETFVDSVADTPVPIAITDAGTGTHTLSATDDTLRAGEEQLTVVSTTLTYTLSIQCYGGLPTGNRSPMNVLRSVLAKSRLPSIRDELLEAGVEIAGDGRVNDVGALINSSRWEPRAHVDVPINVTAEVSETSTIIETAEVTVEASDLVTVGSLAFPLAAPLGPDTELQVVESVTFDVTADDV